MHKRLRAMGLPKYQHDWDQVTCHPEELDRPLRWRKPRMVMVPSMGDLFHEDVPPSFQLQVLSVIRKLQQHTFQILTKRPEVMAAFFDYHLGREIPTMPRNLWLGVSVCEQKDVGMICTLQQIPAALRFISYEPALGPIKWTKRLLKGIGWVICGCESGPKRRQFLASWAGDALEACKQNGIPFFFKQSRDGDNKVVKMPRLNGRVRDQIPEVVR